MARSWLLPLLAIIALVSLSKFNVSGADLNGVNITLYMGSQCGCCEEYVKHLHGLGARVEVRTVNDLRIIMREFRVPDSLQSCHLSIVENYIVVGHMLAEVIKKLINEKPSLRGISLPGMPHGSPGMVGMKIEPFIIYGFNDTIIVYTTI
ncbi:MAG: DUF411 domain-containing protein [Acidilobaceae archaeon]